MAERSQRLAGMSPEKLQRLIDSLRGSAPAPALAPVIRPRRPDLDRLPVSFSQERLWFLDRLDPGSPTFNLPAAVELRGTLRGTALAAALAEVVRRHEALRTTFAAVDGVPVQQIAPPGEAPLPRIDLAALPEEARRREAARLASGHAARRFDLARGPLLAAALLRLEEEKHHLLLTMHHIVSDGWSMGILIREIAALYAAFVEGKPSPLPDLALQYPDFTLWQRETAAAEREQDLAWWSQQLSGATAPLDLPTDRPRPAVQSWRGGWASRTLPADLSDRLRSFGQEEGATLFMTLLAGVQALLHRLAGRDDVAVGSPIAGRRMAETEPLIGFFLNLLVLRTDVSGDPGFRELVRRVREVTLGAYAHQDLPFEALLARLQPERDLSRTPLFQVLFNLLNFPLADQRLPGLEIEAISLPDLPSKFDLTFYVRDEPAQGIAVRLAYNADLFDAIRMEELLDQLALLLAAGLESPDLGVDRISLAATSRARSILPDPAAELSATWEGAVHEVFARHARQTPGALAVADPAESWTYGALDERSSRLAAFLHAGGVRPGDVVAIWAHRSAPLVWGVLGVLRAGVAFLMLDPRHPAPRQARMLEIAGPAAWLRVAAAGPVPAEIESALDAAGCACRLTLPARAEDPDFLTDVPAMPPSVEVGPDDVAYVAFTSGSTGVPKGVLGRHGSLSHFIPWLRRRFELSAADRFSLLSGLAHDPLHRDLFTPLQIGAAVVIPDPATMDEPGRLAAWMRREAVTVAHLTPALGQVLTTEAPGRPRVEVPSLRWVFLVGDVLTRRDVARLRRLAPEVTCVNYYGSTETQRAVGHHVAEEQCPREILPLGRGIPDVQILVLNPAGALAGIGELGEISIRSPHIALGYLGDPELTSQRFVADLYRTGDLGRYLPDGEAVFAGRADTQVKIRGFRIEPGEIEAVLGGFPGVREAAVIARQDRGADLYLAAYVVPVAGTSLAVRELRAFLRERLPDAMVPATFTLLGELPLTPNRKVDRKALPAPGHGAEEAAFAAPESDLEREIAAVWQEVLGIERVGAEDNFFDLGGHSLLLVRLQARLQEKLGRELPLMDLFAWPNVRAQAAHLGRPAVSAPRAAEVRPAAAGGSRRIAVVGMAGRFPGAADLDRFWANLRDGVESISRFTDEELAAAAVDAELLRHPRYVRARGVLAEEDRFDAGLFECSPLQARLMDPQLRVFLECAWEALDHAGYDPSRHPGAIGVYAGESLSTYFLHNLYTNPDLLRSAGGHQVAIANDRDYLTSQLSYKLGLRGPSINVQTACSTSLVAVHLACKALLEGECDMALAGGVSIKVPQVAGYLHEEGGIDSATGRCRPFDAGADGTVWGSGAAIVVLKRLEDALAGGDTIHAVLLGTAVNNDGSFKVGFTAPGLEAQAAVVAGAQARAGVSPESITYVEAHGTGTQLGDPVEVAALTRAFRGRGSTGTGFCALGSVKTNVGHLGAAAGVASLVKTVLALSHRQIPPTLHFAEPNPRIDFPESPFHVNTRLAAWATEGGPRRAGVSSFGMGGTNAHAVLEEAPPVAPPGLSRPWQLLLLSARTPEALQESARRLGAWLETAPEEALPDAAWTLQVGRRRLAWRRSLVCRDAGEARELLRGVASGRLPAEARETTRPPIAFLFPGQGAQHPDMLRGIIRAEPVFRRELATCAAFLAPRLGLDLRELLDPADEDRDEAASRLRQTRFAQPALFAVEYALARLWTSWGVQPWALIGHSVGEYVAACLAGVLSLEDAAALVVARGALMQSLPAGAMLSVELPEEGLRSRLGSVLSLAAVNGPSRCVASGPEEEIAALERRLAAEGVAHRRLHTSHAFHSAMMEPVLGPFADLVGRVELRAPTLPYLSNLTGSWITTEEATDPGYWVRHLRETVRFGDGLTRLLARPEAVLLEVGPGRTLSSLALRASAPAVIASARRPGDGVDDEAALLEALGRLWLAGAEIDWHAFSGEERRRRVPLPAYPFQRHRYWIEPGRAARFDEPVPETLPGRPPVDGPDTAALRSATEGRVAALFEQLLGVAAAGPHDDFFELGGDSLLGTRLATRLREELGAAVPLQAIFDSPTVAGLAAQVEAAIRATGRSAAPPLTPVPRGGDHLPLSFAQERLWFLDRLQPDSAAYNIPTAIRLEGSLDAAALAGALTGVARRHETLRTTFALRAGRPVQVVGPPRPVDLPLVDLAALPEPFREGAAKALADAEAGRPFDLATGPLLRGLLLRLAEKEHRLVLVLHHIVADGWSLGVLIRETAVLYEAARRGRPSPLPELPIQYADYAAWQRSRLTGDVLDGLLGHWRARLDGAPGLLELPTDRPRPPVQRFHGARLRVDLPRDLVAGLREAGRREGATLFMTLLAGLASWLARYGAGTDLPVGAPVAGRDRTETEGLIGLLLNTVVLRSDLRGDPAFGELLARLREVTLDAYAHQELPFERLVEALVPRRDLSHSPLFQVLLVLQDTRLVEPLGEGSDLVLTPLELEETAAKLDLILNLTDTPAGLTGSWRFNRDLFDPPAAARMLRHLQTLLAGAAADPRLRISELPVLTAAESAQLAAWNRTAAGWPLDGCLHERIEAQVERTPGAVAVSFEGEEITYRELNRRANRLAWRLRELGAGPDVPVGICVERSLAMPVGLLAILKAGGAYVPLDPSYPAERLAWMLADAAVPVLLAGEEAAGRLPAGNARIVAPDGEAPGPEENPRSGAGPGNLAYVIYTSGSTGRPKGAMNTHRGILNRLLWMQEAFGLGEDDRVLQKTPVSFDVSVWELFWPLMTGARLVLARPGAHGDPAYLVETIASAAITTVHFVPSMLQVFAAAPGVERCRSLRRVIASGEALPGELQERLAQRLPVPLFNLYGPTEAAVDVTWWACRPDGGRPVPIGRPIANTRVHLLDHALRPVPAGVPGEIFLAGVNLARGYLRRPDLTAERFVPDPAGEPGERLYRTGDRGRHRPDGAIEFLGRLDHQVKIRGVRVELGEIEAALAAHPAVREAVVLAREERRDRAVRDLRLVAYAVPRGERRPTLEELREALAATLPDAMLPTALVVLDALPLNPSGKVDRAALARLDLQAAAPPEAREPERRDLPRTPVERFLAGLFQSTLRLPEGRETGIHDSFFTLGGNSIDAAVLVNRLQEELAEIVHVVVLFEAPTIARLAAYLVCEHPEAVSRLWRSSAPAPAAPAEAGARRIDAALVAELRARIPAPRPAPRRAARNRPAVFVLSPPRSGSTLLRVLLGGHPGLFAPPELELLPYDTLAERRAAFPGPDAFRLEGLPRALMELRRCGPGEARAALAEMEARGTATGEIYGALQDGLGGRLLVDKTPAYTFHAGILRRAEALFDAPRYIHLIRHPYGMIRSFEEAKLDQIFLRGLHPFSRRELAELLWVLGHQNVMEHLREVPAGRQLWVRFEDLVREPERVLGEICAFLGLDYHPDMAEPYRDRAARMTDGLHAESRMLGDVKFHRHAGIDPGVADRWREQVTEDFLGAVTRETAAALGYPLAPPAVPRSRRPAGESGGWEPIPRLRRAPGEPLPLSFSQERLWFLDRLDPGTAAYNVPAALRLTGPLDVPALAGSLREIVRRHEALRTRFALVDGRPAQIVEPAPRAALPLADLSALPEAWREPEARRLAALEAAAPFDLERGPLLRAALLRLGPDEHAALLTLHHIVADGWSMGLLIREVGALYPALVRGEASPLPEPEIQYADFAAWQRRRLAGERLAGLIAGWKERLAGAPAALELPTDRPRPAVQTFRGGKVSFRLGEEAAAALRAPAHGAGWTPFMALLAAFQTLLFRHSGQEDLVVGTPAAGRNRREVEGLIGVFINSLPLRADLSGDPTWSELLRRTRERTLEAFARQDLPFEKLVEELQPARDLARPPVFQVMLAQQNMRSESVELPGLRIAPLGTAVIDAKLELTLSIHEESLGGQLEHNTDLFERATAERMAGHFSTLLAGAAADPGRRLADLPLLTAAEGAQLAAWNRTAEEVPAASVHELLAAQAARTPDAAAVVCGGAHLTYRGLEERANRLAHHLRRLGVRAESPVGLSLERSVDLVAGLLGILKAGGAYLPLDPAYPAERLALVLADSGAAVLVTGQALAEGLFAGLPVRPAHLVLLDAEAERIALLPRTPPASGADPGNLAYVLFTSGSTGRPKGVAVPHHALVSFLGSMRRAPGLAAGDRLLAVTSLSFDIAGLEIWLPLLTGGCVELATREEAADGPALGARLAACGARVMQATPSTWRMLLDTGWAGDPRLVALSGGEALPRALAAALRSRTGALWNLYGPTETTVWSSLLEIGEEEARGGGGAAIGRPIANTSLHVLDVCGRPAAVGIPGELLIGGLGVARGYLGRPDLTAARFVPDPFGAPGARLYRTGDLARRRPDGALELLGRLDHQVKVRGHRIELGEIEAALARHPEVAQAVAVATAGDAGARLTAHLVPRGPVDPAELRAFLARSLPAYMVPGAFMMHGALPLTPNGKIDRQALARLAAPAATAPATPAAPASPLEEAVAGLWAEVLGTGRAGPQDDFFAQGGHSILATLLMHRVRQSFGVDLPLRTLFSAPTVAGLAAAIAARKAEGGEATAELPRIVPDVAGLHLPFPLTDVQEAYWIGRSGALELGSVATHVYFELDATGMDLGRFESAVRRLVECHGMLRAIVQPDGRQRILPAVPPCRIATVDLRGAGAAGAEEAHLALRGHLSHQVLPSDRWPLFELAAALLPEGRMRLYVSLDMLIGDAWSLRLLGHDLGRLYQDPGAALPPAEISFRDYVLAAAALRETAAFRRDLDYWRGRLAEIPPAPQLPLARSPAEIRTPRFVRRAGRLAAAAWSRLKETAARNGLTPSGALLAAWSEVLAAWTGTSRLTLNLTLFNRLPLHPQVNRLVGDFTSLTLLAVERRPGEPFVEQARRTQQRLWDDLDHRLVSGVRVLRELSRLHREPRTLMPVVFTSTLNQAVAPEGRPADGEEAQGEGAWGITQTPQVWLDHQVSESGGALNWKWDAVEELFPAGLLDDMFAAYGRLLERLAGGEEAWHEPVRGLLPAAQLRLREEANATAAPAPAGLLHEPFLAQARLAPEAPAVITSSRTVTYGELDRLSRVLAGRLRRLGTRPNRLVAVVMHKGWEQVAAVLAVLRAGAAYLPLDARLPAERLRHLLARGEIAVALTQPELERSLPWPAGVERVVVDGATEAAVEEGPEPPAPLQAPEDLAYVIFTSGSTGEPKGVMIDHRGASNTVADVNRRFAAGPGDRVLALSSLSFDLSVWDVFGLLAAGGAVVIPDAGTERDPEHWAALAARERVTVWNTVPALMEMLAEHLAGRPATPAAPLRLVLLSGDWIPVHLPGRIRATFPGAQVVSLGGATEASIWSILYPVGEVGEGWASIPYGRPMDNQRFHVLDEDLEPAPVWVPGHLYIGGIGLARGYWRDEEKTAAAFLVHPRTGERLYRTGDLGRLLPDGDVELLGRDDTQVKIQGHRIEPGEIEAALARHPAVGAAVVAATGEARGAKQLVAWVVLAGEGVAPPRPAVIGDPVERLRFKLAHHNLRPDEGRPAVALRRPELSPEQTEALYVRRRSHRRFLREALPLDDLAGWLACLAPVCLEDLPFPKHRYGSAGGLYPVQTWLDVKEGRVEGLAGGLYYHDPEQHRLVLQAAAGGLDASLWDPVNRGAFEESAFAVFLIARLAAIAPLYGERARHFAALEAGLMTQLLETSAADHGLGLAQMGGLRFAEVRSRFALDESCELMHTLLGGRIAPEQARLAALQADMSEQRDLLRLLEQTPDRAGRPATAEAPEAEVFAGLREHLRALLPEHMLPRHFVRIEQVPLSANGKVDRKALPLPAALQAEERPATVPYAPPETEAEQVVARMVAEVLGVPRVGLYDNFFELGANSVQMVRVHNALREALGAEIPIVEIFNHPSVSLLARRLSQSAGGHEPAAAAVADPGAGRAERLREGKDWRRQRLEKRQAADGL